MSKKKNRAKNFIERNKIEVEDGDAILKKLQQEKEAEKAEKEQKEKTPEPVESEVEKEEISMTQENGDDEDVQFNEDEIVDENFAELFNKKPVEKQERQEREGLKSLINHLDMMRGDNKIKENKQNKKQEAVKMKDQIVSGFAKPLSVQFGVTSIEFDQKFKELIAKELPELAKCMMQTSIVVQPIVDTSTGRRVEKQLVKIAMKLDLRKSDELKSTKVESYSPDEDPMFARLFDTVSQENRLNSATTNYKKMPDYLINNGRGILYTEQWDIIKYELFRDKNGKVWSDLVEFEIDASAPIIAMLGYDAKSFLGFVGSAIRMKSLEENLKIQQKVKGKGSIAVPVIYWIQVCVDDIKLVKTGMSMFKKPDYSQAKTKGDKYKSALAEFIGK